MAGFFLKLAAVAAASAIWTTSAAAQDKAYLAEYKLYNEALSAGDAASAEAHGYAAWQAAEAELGDHNLTAILAYNYGNLVLFSAPDKAAPALRRAEALRAAGIADLPVQELALRITFSDFAVAGNAKTKRGELRAILTSNAIKNLPPNEDTARMWLRLASADVGAEDYEEALQSAEVAEAAFIELGQTQYKRRAQALLLSGIATMFQNKAMSEDILSANKIFVKAGKLFQPQEDLATFDRTLAAILAWNNTANALLTSKYEFQEEDRKPRTGTRIKLTIPESDISDPTKFSPFDYEAVFPGSKSSDECNIEWAERKPPKYPTRKGYVGTALVGYRLTGDLGVADAVILAEVPGEIFGEAAVKSMEDWRLADKPLAEKGCTENRLTVFTFVISP